MNTPKSIDATKLLARILGECAVQSDSPSVDVVTSDAEGIANDMLAGSSKRDVLGRAG